MNKPTKILLSIPSLVFMTFFFTYMIEPNIWSVVINSMDDYYKAIVVIQGLTIIQVIVLIRYLWKINKLERKIKTDWTFLLIVFNSVSSLIFIWKKIDEFENKEV